MGNNSLLHEKFRVSYIASFHITHFDRNIVQYHKYSFYYFINLSKQTEDIS